MLRWIRVFNIAVIDQLEVDFEAGLNLLTGETGAGKSILIDAVGLLLGARASTDLVRSGAQTARVEAGFELESFPRQLRRRLAGVGIDAEEGELIIRREVSAGGRGKVIVNGCATAASLLREVAPFLMDIHGQSEHLSLLRPDAGLELLDRVAGCEAQRIEVGDLFQSLAELLQSRAVLEQTARDRQGRREFLEYQATEIQKAALRPDEDRQLAEERKLLVHAEKLRRLSEDTYAVLYEDESSILSKLAGVWKRLGELAEIDERVSPYVESHSSVSSQLEDLALFLRDYRERIRFTPERLEQVEDRLAVIERLKKKYGGTLQEVISRGEGLRQQLADLDSTDERLEQVSARTEEVTGNFLRVARDLSERRRKAAERLEARVQKELGSLALEKARFQIKLSTANEVPATGGEPPASWRRSGLDQVELLFSANPGEELRPLARSASGGELSRFLLALKSVATRGERPKTMVFDEVDAGIGGRVADIVGEKLKELSRTHQVLCITHLPQIARFADAHFHIEKREEKGRAVTRIHLLDSEGRINEIARMLAGAVVTESARKHARQLVSEKL